MFVSLAFFTAFYSISNVPVLASKCGCKTLSTCYVKMLDILQEQDEAFCVADASVGTSTITIFLQALQEFCGDVVTVNVVSASFDNRFLYEVILEDKRNEEKEEKEEKGEKDATRQNKEKKPTIIIDAGQEGGFQAVKFALFIIEQLVACQENKDMIQNVKWVIMPSTNPDGLEYSRYRGSDWRKNLKADDENVSFGVDISRNFDEQWSGCPIIKTGFALNYPGPSASSELETKFIKNITTKHIENVKMYLSIRRDGHHIAYPHGYTPRNVTNIEQLNMIAAEVAHKVNMRSGSIHLFKNDSIYNLEGKERCGHSVDWAHIIGIKWAFEMRIFLERSDRVMSMFQTMPRGYDSTLRNGYFTAIRELYSVLTNLKKYGKLHEVS